jgi:hypothetical protein
MTLNHALVSIIIPAYNSEQWISDAAKSALAQTWPHKEIIIIDDGSNDATLKIAQSFSSKSLKVISQDNRGASSARNKGLQDAQGDYIQFLDADDLLAPNKIECQIKLLREFGGKYISSGSWAPFVERLDDAEYVPDILWQDMGAVDWIVCAWQDNKYELLPLHAWLTPRCIVEKAGRWNEQLTTYEDSEYFCRIILSSHGIKFCPEAKCLYRRGNSGSLSHRRSITDLESIFKAYELCANHLLQKENSCRTRTACATIFLNSIYLESPEVPNVIQRAEQFLEQLPIKKVDSPGLFGGSIYKLIAKKIGWREAVIIRNIYKRVFA